MTAGAFRPSFDVGPVPGGASADSPAGYVPTDLDDRRFHTSGACADTFNAAAWRLGQALRSAGRDLRASLPRPIRQLLGDDQEGSR